MNIEESRQQFEAWVKSKWPDTYLERIPEIHQLAGNYWEVNVQMHWVAWQASREMLVIKLPERMPKFAGRSDYWDGAHNGFNQCLDTCKVHFEFSGLKVRP